MKNIRLLNRDGTSHTDSAEPLLASALRRLGFTDHEARAYLALIAGSPATAYEVANASGLPRANAYNVLRTLQAKGAIQPVSQEPLRYVPVDANDFFGRIEKTTSALCRDVVKQVERKAPNSNDAYVWITSGHREVIAKIKDLVDGAKAEVWIKAAAHLLEPVIDCIVAAANRGVEVRIILYGAAPRRLAGRPRVKLFAHEGEGTAQGISDMLYTMTVDLDGVVIASFTGETTASYARNPSIIYMTQVYLLHEMYLSDIYAVMGSELDRHFGKGLAKLRQKYRPHNMERYVVEEAAGGVAQKSSSALTAKRGPLKQST